MSGKRAAAVYTEDKPFAKNLSDLMTEHKETQKKLAEQLGVKQQTISYYRNGQSTPDADNLVKIAQHYGVSTDFLLGLSGDIRTVDNSVKVICEYTGLSEETVSKLHNPLYTEFPLLQYFINTLATSSDWILLELQLRQLIALCDKASRVDITPPKLWSELIELEREIGVKSHGVFQLQPIHEQIEQVYSKTVSLLGSIVDEITDCNKAKEAANEKWVELLRMARHPNAQNAGGETNA